jgi:hypothetical protein
VGDGDVRAVDGVAVEAVCGRSGLVMGDDLVAEEVEIDPVVGAAALRAAQDGAVKVAGGGEVVDREGDVERADLAHW